MHSHLTPRRRARVAAAVTAAVAGLALTVGGAPGALAVTGFHTSASGVRVHAQASTGSGQVGTVVAAGTALDIACQTAAEQVTASGFGTSRIWDRLNGYGYGNGYISDLFVRETAYGRLDSRLPVCPTLSTPPTVQPAPGSTAQMLAAAQWAIAEKNSPRPEWSDHYGHYWTGWCEQFVEQAEGFRFTFTSALEDYQWERSQGRIHPDANPPVGALVFYSGGASGHVAVSIGGGQAVGTYGTGTDGKVYPVKQYAVVGYLTNPYLGWANPKGS